MSFTFDVLRGTQDGKVLSDRVTKTLEPNDVYVEITHSGLCGTDEHFLGAGVAAGRVLGHEGIGIVKQLGSAVTGIKVGDRVGLGYIHKYCGHCENCLTGWDQYCNNKKVYGMNDPDVGTFGRGAVWDADCVFPIPDGMDSTDAAPLVCAGGTVWEALSAYGAQANDRVGILGVGGLGHLAIKLAAAIGCHVVVLSSSESKREEAMSFGASEFRVFRSGDALEGFKPLKYLLVAGSAAIDYNSLIPLMAARGTIFPLTVEDKPNSVPLLPMLLGGIRIQGTFIFSRHRMHQLLEFCAAKNIKPTTMEFPMTVDGTEEALQKLRTGKIRYRAVLVRPSA
ncbi:hypothetical protein FQN50_003348 [Emmonsiellopsis sp. PD_5]|nr:hypothetical protein FQN50_003348 [Emmonsiellopsis sp. PD_5]